jgi:TolA-binding protein
MTRDPETVLLGGLIIVLLMAIALAVVFLRRGRAVPDVPSEGQISPEHPQDIVPWVLEGRRLFDLWQERIERLDELKSRLSAMAQEIEQLRAEIGQISEMRAQIARLGEENERGRAERDRLREALTRIATLAHEAAADRPE